VPGRRRPYNVASLVAYVEFQHSLFRTIPRPGIMPGSSSRTYQLALASPLPWRHLVGATGMMPDAAVRTGERSGALTDAVDTLSATLIDASLGPDPMEGPGSGLCRCNRYGAQSQHRGCCKDHCLHSHLHSPWSKAPRAGACARYLHPLLCQCFACVVRQYCKLLLCGS
jgi:hypothetical protein